MNGGRLGDNHENADDIGDDEGAPDSQARDPRRPRESAKDAAERACAEEEPELCRAHAEGAQHEEGQQHPDARVCKGRGGNAGKERVENALAAHEGEALAYLGAEGGIAAHRSGLGRANAPDRPRGRNVGGGGQQVDQGSSHDAEEPAAQSGSPGKADLVRGLEAPVGRADVPLGGDQRDVGLVGHVEEDGG